MRPRAESLRAVGAVIERNLESIRLLTAEVAAILERWNECSGTYTGRAGLGFALHNIYNALENTFDQISRTFENHVVNDQRWHAELLGKMFLVIPEVRPAVLPGELFEFLSELRGFRHIFRHSYTYQLDGGKLQVLGEKWMAAQARVVEALAWFGRELRASDNTEVGL